MEELIVKKIAAAFIDDRGSIFDIIDNENIKHIGLITIKAGKVRGNHYHEKQRQWMYVVSGKMELYLKDMRKGDAPVKASTMESGDIIFLPPKVVHTVKAIEDSVFLDINDLPRGDGSLFEEDTKRIKII